MNASCVLGEEMSSTEGGRTCKLITEKSLWFGSRTSAPGWCGILSQKGVRPEKSLYTVATSEEAFEGIWPSIAAIYGLSYVKDDSSGYILVH